jgi:hypothetical protein
LEKKLDSAGLERFKPELEKIPDKALAVPAPEIKPGFDASYSRAKKTITLDKDPGFTGGRPEALHHEWAHHLHYEIEAVTNSSVDAALDKAMQNDYNDWLRAAKLKHGPEFESKLKFIDVEKMSKAQRPLYEAALQEHAQDAGYQLDLSRRASEERIRALLYFDTIGAISKGEYGWGHSKEAYSANNGGAKEAFANIYTAFIRGWTEFAIFAETLKWIRDKFQQ